MLDDEDGDSLPSSLHAQGEHDDMEEETLEGAEIAISAAMIREMSIDQITRPAESADGRR